jgi:4-amino-4-deoxy-L-arabinose transferase-like glycosyltransferase
MADKSIRAAPCAGRLYEAKKGEVERMAARAERVGRAGAVAALCAAALLLVALSMIAPLNHDESQYAAAAELARAWRPFVDFLHLQTPYQIYLFAPLVEMAGPYAFPALRAANALLGAGTLALVYAALRVEGVERGLALGCALLLALCQPFQFGATVVRNDALPAFLEAGGIAFALLALRGGQSWSWAAAGLLLGAAAGAKLSYAFPLAALALWQLTRLRDAEGRKGAFACAAGAALALFPLLLVRAAAPEAFDYGVFHYGGQAPFAWYSAAGAAAKLTPWAKLTHTAHFLAAGPAAPAFLWLAWRRVKAWRTGGASEAARLLDLLVLAGLAAALAPTPTWQQYLIPMLPPLFIALGLELSRARPKRRDLFAGVFLLFALIGLVQPVRWIAGGGENGLTAARQAHWIGSRVRESGLGGGIATLSPHLAIGSMVPLDRRFAAGPFYYRTGDRHPPHVQRGLNATAPSTTAAFLDERPPAALLTGYEHDSRGVDLDRPLRRWAQARGYRLEKSPHGRAELWLAPGVVKGSAR